VLSKVYANKREYELSESNARQKNLAEAQKYNKDENYYTNLKNNYYAQEKSQKEAIVSFSGQDIQGWKNINSDKLMKLKRKENALTAYSSSVALAVDEKEIENLTDNQIIQQLKERNRQL
jgi:hypothetical protein